jgi:hypothetical protein
MRAANTSSTVRWSKVRTAPLRLGTTVKAVIVTRE